MAIEFIKGRDSDFRDQSSSSGIEGQADVLEISDVSVDVTKADTL
jgi:hypothetical protein